MRLGWDLSIYFSLTEQSPAKVTRWEIGEKGSRYGATAVYEYTFQDQIFRGKTTLQDAWMSEAGALSEIKEKSLNGWVAHYNPENPVQSSLEKRFPMGYLVRSGLCFCVLIYFYMLRKKLTSIISS